MNTITTKLAAIFVLFFTLIGCREDSKEDDFFNHEREEASGGEEVHPKKEAIPYYDREHLSIDQSRSISAMEDVPVALEKLKLYLERGDEAKPKELDIDAYDTTTLIAGPLNNNDWVLMDPGHQRLIQFNPVSGDTAVIAGAGQGPGELQYPADIGVTQDGNELYIAQQDMRIDRYDCASEVCSYEETLTTENLPYSLAVSDNDEIAVVTIPDPVQGDIKEDRNLISLFDEEGNQLNQFGSPYNTDVPIAYFNYNNQANICYSHEAKVFVKSFSSLPMVYTYNREGGLENTFKISPFQLETTLVNEETGRSEHRAEQSSSLRFSLLYDKQYALLQISKIGNFSDDEQASEYEQRYDFYVLNITNGKSYFIGTKHQETSHSLSITPIQDGIVINEGGVLKRYH